MKKLFTVLVVLLAAQAVFAQQYKWFAGGAAGVTKNKDNNTGAELTQYTFSPEVGRVINDKWDIGLGLAYSSINNPQAAVDFKSYKIGPFARYHFLQIGKLNFLLKGKAYASFDRSSGVDGNILGLSVAPLVSYGLNKRIALFAELNFLSINFEKGGGDLYDYTNFKIGAAANNVANSSNFQVGFFYKF